MDSTVDVHSVPDLHLHPNAPLTDDHMHTAHQVTASVHAEPLLTLSAYRRDPHRGRVTFGVLLDLVDVLPCQEPRLILAPGGALSARLRAATAASSRE